MKVKFILIVFIILFIYFVTKKEDFMNLPFKVKYSKKINANGLFADRDIKKGEVVEVCPTIIDKKGKFIGNVADYPFKFSKDESALALGYCGMLNHSDNPNCTYNFEGKNLVMKATKNIKKGEELHNSYGSSWWKARKDKIKKIE